MSTMNPNGVRNWPSDETTLDTGAILSALEDDACRSILETASHESLTATELSERCEIPTSTAYRKVEKLTEANLVEERVRINTSGKHATEYRTSFDDVVVSVADGGSVEIELTKPTADSESAPALASD
ncbi:winged helix-turn-helix domain-containing protein [Natrarchaeobius chitinivorans]|uniref:ArsR family transcriptional regulator n=1 Tax=Natrarchaeobius chitinivorans TaxID=1679083 RepID=A0A3N6P861_NATCH|nr:helix-turn-helix domain-containing protein [Natrarchaeobius chitinivorans]RQG92265.1 ArsR family transcriptional regulator [Natrarchaeobius chitinivorans]